MSSLTREGGRFGHVEHCSRFRCINLCPINAHHATHKSFKVPVRIIVVEPPLLCLKHLIDVARTKKEWHAFLDLLPLMVQYHRNKLAHPSPLPHVTLTLGINSSTVAEKPQSFWVYHLSPWAVRAEELTEGWRANENDVMAAVDASDIPLEHIMGPLVTEVEVRGHTEAMGSEVVVQEGHEECVFLHSGWVWSAVRGAGVWEVAEEDIVASAQ